MTIEILDSVHDAGKVGGSNDDDWGNAGDCVWVFDGATGLGDEQLTDTASDAMWLAQAGTKALKARAPSYRGPLTGLIDEVIGDASRWYDETVSRPPAERYERPTAGLILARSRGRTLECLNFGDCKILLREASGAFRTYGSDAAAEAYETQMATRFSEQRKEEGITGEPTQHRHHVLDHLRKVRNRHNTPGGYWVFGLDANAAEHARTTSFDVETPATALLMTDGFEALAGDYGRYTEEELLDAAFEKGLASLLDELRHIERVLDPEAHRYPRFKQSDDATAVLVRIG